MDVLFIGIAIIFFLLSRGFVRLSEKL